MTAMMDGPLEIAAHQYSDAYLRPACSDVVYVRGNRVDVPAGFQLAKGPVQAGDEYLDYTLFRKSCFTTIEFRPADRFIGQQPAADVTGDQAADGFAMLIRPFIVDEA